MRAATHEHDSGGEGRRHHARLCGEWSIAHVVRNRLRGIRDVDLDVHGLLPFPVGPWPRLNNAAPSLQLHYKAFVANTGCSVPTLRVGTLALAVGTACGFFLPPNTKKRGGWTRRS